MEGKDKRIYKRLKMQVNLRYRIISPDLKMNDEYLTIAENLSAGGVAFLTEERLKVGAILQLTLEPPAFDAPIVSLSRVMRTEPAKQGGSYLIGACFLDMTGLDRKRLDQFVARETF